MATKKLHAMKFDGTTFGMNIDTSTKAWKAFGFAYLSAQRNGRIITVAQTPYKVLAPILGEAHWLVDENMEFDYIQIEGFNGGDKIYVMYTDGLLNFDDRLGVQTEMKLED